MVANSHCGLAAVVVRSTNGISFENDPQVTEICTRTGFVLCW